MTNFEYWKDEILRITDVGSKIALKNNKLSFCSKTNCDECEFDDNCGACWRNKAKWLYEEHVDLILTKKERLFCELVGTGWIAKDHEKPFYYTLKPTKGDTLWIPHENEDLYKTVNTDRIGCTFDFIKWEDAEPWSVEELLKLEVKRGGEVK